MPSCSSALCILILLVTQVTAGSESADPTVRVNLHDSATLPCSERCSGVVRWTVFHKRDEVLAECDQTSCRSVKEGYQMIHDQYLNGNFSLTITDADLSKRGWYTCDCDGTDLCDVRLQIEPLRTTVQLKPGEALALELDVSDPVKVVYNSAGGNGPSSGQICTVDGGSLQCRPDYTQRASLTAALELRGLTPSDGGVYTIVDIRNDEVIHTYTVTFQDQQSEPDGDPGVAVPVWGVVLLAVMGAVLLAVILALTVWIVWLRRENHRLRIKDPNSPVDAPERGNSAEEEKLDINPEVRRTLPVRGGAVWE